MQESTQTVITALKKNGHLLQGKTVTAGFDGFIDSIVRIIDKKRRRRQTTWFNTIGQWGRYIASKKNASFSLEMEQQEIKPGGNMPNMANALGTMGVRVNCIGSLGWPEIHPVFRNLSSNCRLHSFANPGTATAVEFNDGKMFLAEMGSLHTTGWQKINDQLGAGKISNMLKQSDLLCLLNWSEIDASTNIWKGLLADCLSDEKLKKPANVFVDLSDCSKRSFDEVKKALNILKKIGRYSQVTLSLNHNEAAVIYRMLKGKTITDPIKHGDSLYASLSVATLVIHSSKGAMAVRKDEQCFVPSFHIVKPRLSTGAGDNFNAGFCIAQLLELDLEPALLFANATAGLYVRNGKSATPRGIIRFLQNKQPWN